MAANYVLIEKISVGAAGASSVTFNSIPQTGYTDLVIKFSGRNTADSSQTLITLNGSTSTYTGKRLYGSGSAATSDAGNTANFNPSSTDASSYTANTFGNAEIYIPNYTSSNYKSVSIDGVTENNATTAYGGIFAGLWSTTSAITSVSLAANSGNWAQYSTFYLYGVAKLNTTPAIVPYATGGDTIMTDGTYWYHAFLSSGTFTPLKSLSCDVLTIAGGGGGAANQGGGGGAGGVYYATSQSFSSSKTVTVGAGGAGGVENVSLPTQGSSSVLGSLTTAVGGGIGGADNTSGAVANGGTGGSGGGGLYSGTGGAATSGQGNAGGNGGSGSLYYGGGGGGGAGAVGANYVQPNAGAGGAGTNTYSSWLSTTGLGVSGYVAGGGGGGGSSQHVYNTTNGGAGGSGGGGAGGNGTTSAVAGTANTGSGGGSGGRTSTSFAGKNGGSGLVIVRYAV